MKNIILLLFFLSFTSSTIAQTQIEEIKSDFDRVSKSELMILGTFHFNNRGLDGYVPKNSIDIMSNEKQKELKAVIDIVKKYAPTKIAIEVKKSNQKWVDSIYNSYLKGNYKLQKNEIYQIGFRLAKLLGHKKVYAVDSNSKSYFEEMTEEESNKKQYNYIQKAKPESVEREMMLDRKFTELYTKDDVLKAQMPLLDYYLYINHPERLRIGAGHYLTGAFKMGEGDDYFGPDMKTSWFNRNLRIFHNLTKIQTPGEDKVFLLIGAGHLPILNFLTKTSPDFEFKKFKSFVSKK